MKRTGIHSLSFSFEQKMKENIKQAKKRLDSDFKGSKEAMLLQAMDKVKQFQIACDTILGMEEKEILTFMLLNSMFQTFSYGYGIGRVEGETLEKVVL